MPTLNPRWFQNQLAVRNLTGIQLRERAFISRETLARLNAGRAVSTFTLMKVNAVFAAVPPCQDMAIVAEGLAS